MMNFQMYYRSTNCAQLWELSQRFILIGKDTVCKCWIFVANLVKRHFSRFDITITRAKNCFIVRFSKLFIAKRAIYICNRISRFVCTGNRTKFSFFSSVMNKLNVANLTTCCDMVVSIITYSRAIKFVRTFFSSFRNALITTSTMFFHYQPLYQRIIYG